MKDVFPIEHISQISMDSLNNDLNDIEAIMLRTAREQNIFKRNELARAYLPLSLQQHKIINYLLSLVKPDDPPGKIYEFYTTEFCKIAGIRSRSGANREAVKQSLMSINQAQCWVRDPQVSNKEILFMFFSNAEHLIQKGSFQIQFSEVVNKYILGLKDNFTSFQLDFVMPMKCQHAPHLYEILRSYGNIGYVLIDLDDLRKQLGLEKKYLNGFAEFRKNVIEPAVTEINSFTDMNVEWSPRKFGKKVSKIFFLIKTAENSDMIDGLERSINRSTALNMK